MEESEASDMLKRCSGIRSLIKIGTSYHDCALERSPSDVGLRERCSKFFS